MLPDICTMIPGPRSQVLARELQRVESANVTYISPHFPVFWARAEGVNVWDVDGNRFLDLTSGFGVASLGFSPPPIVRAMGVQAAQLYHAMGDVHPTEEKVRLCAVLSRLTFEAWLPGTNGKTILTNSGSEAVEAALKTAWLATKKTGVLAFSGSYHGLGFGALTATGRHYFRDPFAPQLANWARFLPYPSSETERMDEPAFLHQAEAILAFGEIGAILVEPIQGRGGEVVPEDWLLPALRRLADKYQAILIFDEIFTGFYRTGPRFACDAVHAVPDLICLGKALTSGFPLAACVGRADLMDRAWPKSTGEAWHTSTFLGNPLGCRMALTSLELLESAPWQATVEETGAYLAQRLTALYAAGIPWGKPRGRGLMQGLAVVDALGQPDPALAGHFVEATLGRGVILLSGGVDGNILSFTPPFTISRSEIDFTINVLEETTPRKC